MSTIEIVPVAGVQWCSLHHGVRNEDSDTCDAADWLNEDVDEDGEPLPCVLHDLCYEVI